MKSLPRILLVVLLSIGGAFGAQSQDVTPAPPESTVTVLTYVETSAASIPRAIGLLHQYREAGRTEAGNSLLELRQEVGQPYRFAIITQWQDQAALDAHERGTVAMELYAGLSEIQTAPPETIVLQGFAVGPVRESGGGRAQTYAMSHIEISPDRIEEFRALVTPYVETSRSDGGGMRFDVLQMSNAEENHLVILESWTSPRDYEAHRSSEHAASFRDGLAPMLIDLRDDRLYGGFD